MTDTQALSKIAAYCSKAERCEYDVRKKLEGWKLEEKTVESIILKLQKENFLNEKRFCESFIKDKLRFNKWGKTKIIYELRKKHVPDTLIREVFAHSTNDEDFEESLMQVLISKIKTVKGNTEYEKKGKLMRFALGRGYSQDMITKCLNILLKNKEDE